MTALKQKAARQKRTNIMIDDKRKKQIKKIGGGNLSAGIRKLADDELTRLKAIRGS